MADTEAQPSEPATTAHPATPRSTPTPPTPPEPPEPPKRKPWRRPGVLVGVALVIAVGTVAVVLYLRHAAMYESTDDAFIASHVTQIAPRVPGVVQRVYVQDNQLVQRGDPLFELDAADFDLDVARAQTAVAAAKAGQSQGKASLAAAQARVSQTQANIEATQAKAQLAHQTLQRTRKLQGSGAQSAQALDSARSAADAADAEVAAARQQLVAAHAAVAQAQSNIEAADAASQQARVALDNAQLRRSYVRVVAPSDGRITNSSLEAGDYLQIGQQVMSLVALHVWVKANFKETQLAHMRPGQSVDIEVDAYARTWHGRVDSFQQGTGASFSLLPPENATGNYVKVVARVPVKIVFDPLPNPHRYLLAPGMSVVPTVKVTSRAREPMVPAPYAPSAGADVSTK